MKAITKIFLAAAVMSGAVSVHVSREDDSIRIETEVRNPEEVIESAGKLISYAGDALAGTGRSSMQQTPASEAAAVQTVYRVRGADGSSASQLYAFCDLDTAIRHCPAGCCVFDQNGCLLYQAAP